jgi:hypothetical protein
MSRSHEMAISCRNVDVEETTYYLLTVRPYTATRHNHFGLTIAQQIRMIGPYPIE